MEERGAGGQGAGCGEDAGQDGWERWESIDFETDLKIFVSSANILQFIIGGVRSVQR